MADTASLADRVRGGDLHLYELEARADANIAAEVCRLLVESQSGASFDAVGNHDFLTEVAESAIEDMVGSIQVSTGVVGPVSVDGGPVTGEKYLPLAVIKGTFLASINHGCSAINSVGGATTRVLKFGMTRAPVFRATNITGAEVLVSWARGSFVALREATEETTNHGELLDVTSYVVGSSVHLRLRYDAKDAMGMNMTIVAAEAICSVVEAETAASFVALSGSLCSGKKPAVISAVKGRGRSITTGVRIPYEVVEERPHITSETVVELNTRKGLVGSAKVASLGLSAHVVNVVAVMFLAAGQNEAQVAEGTDATTTAEVQDSDLYAPVSIISPKVGTAGGGTRLPTQSKGLDILGVSGSDDPIGLNADVLVECIAVGFLAGEPSLLSTLASWHLSSTHAELGR